MGFAGSVNSAEELSYELMGHQAILMGKRNFQRFLKEKYPNCSKHYDSWRSASKTTWQLEIPAQVLLFETVRDSPALLDYTLAKIRPRRKQVLGLPEVTSGLEAIEGLKFTELIAWAASERGLKERIRMYER